MKRLAVMILLGLMLSPMTDLFAVAETESLRAAYESLFINEVCPSNGSSLLRGDGSSPDWIELYNASEDTLDLSGCGLSDRGKNPFRYTFPEGTTLEPDSYLLILCVGDEETAAEGEYLAPFRIGNKKGETIFLTHPQYGTLDRITLPPGLEKDVSYGRDEDQGYRMLSATPGRRNEKAGKVPDALIFSQESGFYDEAFELWLSTDGGEIWYTLDGSDPRRSETAVLFADAISVCDNSAAENVCSAVREIQPWGYEPPKEPVDKGVVVRAAVRDEEGNFSDPETRVYFIGKEKAYYFDLTVVSLVSDPKNLFDDETGIYVDGAELKARRESDGLSSDWDLLEHANYWKRGREWERPVSMQVFREGALVYTAEAGVRIAGNWSRSYAQKSLRLYARKSYGTPKFFYDFFGDVRDASGQKITEFSRITLRSGGNDLESTRFRDDLVQTLLADQNVSTQASEPCIVFLNGEFWGLYMIRERFDEKYIAAHYGVDENDLVINKVGDFDPFDENVFNAFNEFYLWLTDGPDWSDPAGWQRVCETFDIKSYADLIAVQSYICNEDFGGNNWMMWRVREPDDENPYADGRWRFMLYDLDVSANYPNGDYFTGPDFDALSALPTERDEKVITSMLPFLMQHGAFREQLAQSFREVAENLSPEKIHEQIDLYVARLTEAELDTRRRYFAGEEHTGTGSTYAEEIERLRSFYETRPDWAQYYLKQYLHRYELNEQPPEGECILFPTNWVTCAFPNGQGEIIANGRHKAYQAGSLFFRTYDFDPNFDGELNELQVLYPALSLGSGKRYRLTFQAASTAQGEAEVIISETTGEEWADGAVFFRETIFFSEPYSDPQSLETVRQTYAMEFTMPADCDHAKLAFSLGHNSGTYLFSDISLICLD